MTTRKYALITGASSGMGREYALRLADKGWSLILTALRQDETDAVAHEISTLHPDLDVVAIGMDLTTAGAAERLFDTVCTLRPEAEVEVLINNAGIIHLCHFRHMTSTQIRQVIALHNTTTTLLCWLFLPAMARRGKGYVLNISSITSALAWPFVSTYAAAKAFTRNLTKSLRAEYRGTGVSVATIYFGAVDTPLFKLAPKHRRLLRRLGVMISPKKAVDRALKMLFRGHSGYIVGFVNQLAVIFGPLLPTSLLHRFDIAVSKKLAYKR